MLKVEGLNHWNLALLKVQIKSLVLKPYKGCRKIGF